MAAIGFTLVTPPIKKLNPVTPSGTVYVAVIESWQHQSPTETG